MMSADYVNREAHLWSLLSKMPEKAALQVLEGYTDGVNADRIMDGDRPYSPRELMEYAYDALCGNLRDMGELEAPADLEEKIAEARVLALSDVASTLLDDMYALLVFRLEDIDPDEELEDWEEARAIMDRAAKANLVKATELTQEVS